MKNILKTIIILLLILSFQSCNRQKEIPKELKFSFEYLNKNWDSKEIESFKNFSKNDTAPRNYHFGVGMYLRNNLLRHHEQSENITKFFDSIGIHHHDDMSSIILTSYQKYLNEEDIQLQTQVEKHIAFWKPIIDCEQKLKTSALKIYNTFKIDDTLHIQMPVSKSNSVVDYVCPYLDWEFNELKDLYVKGIVVDKASLNSDEEKFFMVKVLSKNHLHIDILMKYVNIGDEFKVRLETAWKIE